MYSTSTLFSFHRKANDFEVNGEAEIGAEFFIGRIKGNIEAIKAPDTKQDV